MERYISIDSGKFATKVAEYSKERDLVKKFSIRTKVSDGDFRDDAIEKNTYVVEIDGKQYKVGNGARGQGAELITDKKTDTHRICVLTVLGMLASSNENDTINVAIGLPANEWANVTKRMDFKDYILPQGKVTVKIKKDSRSEVVSKTFTIGRRYVFPESIGALFSDEMYNSIEPTSITGVIDIGNLNLNATYWQGTELIMDKSITADLGGALLIQELSQELSSHIVPTEEMIAANVLKSTDRVLPMEYGLSEEQAEESRDVIKRVLLNHAKEVKRQCNSRKWSLDLMKVIAIGGTSKDIEAELKSVFSNIIVLPTPEYCNVLGFLRIMCAQDPGVGKEISISDAPKETKKTDKKAS
jgi:plasmid segregation protein ParM